MIQNFKMIMEYLKLLVVCDEKVYIWMFPLDGAIILKIHQTSTFINGVKSPLMSVN